MARYRTHIITALVLLVCHCVHAQFYFGRNKVQYEHFNWQVLSTEHFNIYYYPEEYALANAALNYCEEFLQELEQKFNQVIYQPIPLVIYSNHIHFQQTNILTMPIPEGIAGFFEYIKRRVVIPYNGNMTDFRHTLKHELVHVFFYYKVNSAASDIGAWESPNFPLWFTEGLAEYWSQGWDPQTELIVRDAILHDYLYPLNSYELYETGFLLYKEGQAFLRFFEERYTADRLRWLMENFWRYDSFEKALKGVTGKTLLELESEWRVSLKKRFAVHLLGEEVIEPDGTQLTRYGANVSPVVFTNQNGQKEVAFLTSRNGYTDIYRTGLLSRKEKPLLRAERRAGRESLHFLQSGIHIDRGGDLIFVTKSGARDVLRIVNLATKREIGSLECPSVVSIRSPKWSEDGNLVVFAGQDYSGQTDLYIWRVVESQALRLTNDIYFDSDPSFSPDGKLVVFCSDRGRREVGSGTDLCLMNLKSGEILRLTNGPGSFTRPFWAPNQPDQIFCLADRSGTPNLWKVNLPHADSPAAGIVATAQPLTNLHTGLQDFYPVSGDTILVSAFRKYAFQVHRLNLAEKAHPASALTFSVVKPDSAWRLPSGEQLFSKRSRPYRLKYSLDFAQTNIVHDPIFGFLGGAQLGISDLLGNRYYHFLLANTAQATSEIMDHFNLAVTMVDLTRRANKAVGVFHFANDYYNPYEGFYYERALGLRGGLSYPIDVFRRLEFSASLWHSTKDYYYGKFRRATLLSNYASFVHDNSIWTYTGPLDGWSLRLTAGPTFDFKHSRFYNYTALGDLRLYFRLHRNLTWAQRWIAWFNEGTDIYQFYIGGSWGMRGYDIREIYGCKYVMFNQELRFPFAESLMLRFVESDIRLSPIRGAVFFDVGNAWDDAFPGLLGSFGFGLRGVLFGGLVLRLDMGKCTDFETIQKPWFLQFFFGWDY